MKVYSLMLGSYQTNCYLAADDDGVCAVIDPGYTPERVLEAAQRYGLTIRAVLLTHGHFDHVGGVRGVAEAARCPVWLCEADTVLPERLTAGPLYYTDTYADGDTVEGRKPALYRAGDAGRHARLRASPVRERPVLRRHALCRLLRPCRSGRRRSGADGREPEAAGGAARQLCRPARPRPGDHAGRRSARTILICGRRWHEAAPARPRRPLCR